MYYKEKIISREPGVFHGLSSATSVICDAVENCNYYFYGDVRQEIGSGGLPNLAQHLDAVASKQRENPCNIETTVKR